VWIFNITCSSWIIFLHHGVCAFSSNNKTFSKQWYEYMRVWRVELYTRDHSLSTNEPSLSAYHTRTLLECALRKFLLRITNSKVQIQFLSYHRCIDSHCWVGLAKMHKCWSGHWHFPFLVWFLSFRYTNNMSKDYYFRVLHGIVRQNYNMHGTTRITWLWSHFIPYNLSFCNVRFHKGLSKYAHFYLHYYKARFTIKSNLTLWWLYDF